MKIFTIETSMHASIPKSAAIVLYDSECWLATKDKERCLAVMETELLRWISGINRYDHARNNHIRNRYIAASAVKKLEKKRLYDMVT